MKPLLLLILFLFSIQSLAQSEHRQYAIKVVGIKVGELIATKTKKMDDTIEYSLESQVNVNFLIYHLKVDYGVRSVFQKDTMQFSKVSVFSNRGDFNTNTEKTSDGYFLKFKQPKKHIEKILTSDILHSFSSMHFNEPVGKSTVYAEFYGDFINIEPLSGHKYSGILDDNRDEYYFEDGLLVKAVKKNAIADMVIVLEKSWVSNK